jgi:hypothetical protein
MALDFPNAPTTGQTFQNWKWDGVKWVALAIAATVLRGYIDGLTLSVPTAAASFGVNPGVVADKTSAAYISLSSAWTKTTAAWAAGTANGALDTGAIAANTWYHVHAIKNVSSGAVDVLLSLSPTAPNLPSGFTLFQRIMALKTNASSQFIPFTQFDDNVFWVTTVQDLAATSTTGPVTVTATVPTGLAVMWFGTIGGASTTNEVEIRATELARDQSANMTWSLPNAEIAMVQTNVGVARVAAPTRAYTNTLAQFIVRQNAVSGATIFANTVGWNDPRGKNS